MSLGALDQQLLRKLDTERERESDRKHLYIGDEEEGVYR